MRRKAFCLALNFARPVFTSQNTMRPFEVKPNRSGSPAAAVCTYLSPTLNTPIFSLKSRRYSVAPYLERIALIRRSCSMFLAVGLIKQTLQKARLLWYYRLLLLLFRYYIGQEKSTFGCVLYKPPKSERPFFCERPCT